MDTSKLIVIVGETASGKSNLALRLAQHMDGEIICADSRTVYRGLDVGTAKPSAAERAAIRHYGLDLVDPDQRFNVADFKAYAQHAITTISTNGKLPIMVGGSGLYIDAVLYDFQFPPAADPALRRELQGLHVSDLQQRIRAMGLPLPRDPMNSRRLVRVIETGGKPATQKPLRPHTAVIGLSLSRDVLRGRIADRVDAMIKHGFVDEVRQTAQKYGWEAPALQAPGYQAFQSYISGNGSLEQARAAMVHEHMSLAKRQRTWFQRNKSIHWLANSDTLAEAVDYATTLLNT